jgi:ssDNA-binding Zn-finger/Zn-ribbon topoisomerase 1
MQGTCARCNTPLDEAGVCVTCAADAEGLKVILRSGFAEVRELHTLLEDQGFAAEMERVPAIRPEEKAQPRWNLYVPEPDVTRAVEFLSHDWAHLLTAPDAVDAAARGQQGIDLDAGGEVTCPACGHVFQAAPGGAECPDCGLSLAAPGGAATDESSNG